MAVANPVCCVASYPDLKANNLQALLRAIGNKIVPGIPYSINIALLQQTVSSEERTVTIPPGSEPLRQSALEFILKNDIVKNGIQEELDSKREPSLCNSHLELSFLTDTDSPAVLLG